MEELDLDLKTFFSGIKLWGIIVAVFGTLATIIFMNRFGSNDIRINKKIDSKKAIIILIVKTDTKNKEQIEKELKKEKFKYEIVYSDKERYYDEFLRKLSLEKKEVIEPTILYVEDGVAKYSLVDAKEKEEVNAFLDQINKE